MAHPVARAPHIDTLSRTFLFILRKVAFNQAVFSGRKIIPRTSKPGSDTNMAPGQSGADWTVPLCPTVAGEIAKDITEVNQASSEISNSSSQVNMSAEELSKLAEKLKEMVGRFRV